MLSLIVPISAEFLFILASREENLLDNSLIALSISALDTFSSRLTEQTFLGLGLARGESSKGGHAVDSHCQGP